MSDGVYSVRLDDSRIIQIRGNCYSVTTDIYPEASSRYRADFRLIAGIELTSGFLLSVVEVALTDTESERVIYAFAKEAPTPAEAIAYLDQFDPTAYLEIGHMQPHDLADLRNRYDERARRFRNEAIAFFEE
jgi:hypothetical protein